MTGQLAIPVDFDAALPAEIVEAFETLTRVLLDTHVLLWALGDPERLTASVQEMLEGPGNDVLSALPAGDCGRVRVTANVANVL